jgi:hypothetical protein
MTAYFSFDAKLLYEKYLVISSKICYHFSEVRENGSIERDSLKRRV